MHKLRPKLKPETVLGVTQAFHGNDRRQPELLMAPAQVWPLSLSLSLFCTAKSMKDLITLPQVWVKSKPAHCHRDHGQG